ITVLALQGTKAIEFLFAALGFTGLLISETQSVMGGSKTGVQGDCLLQCMNTLFRFTLSESDQAQLKVCLGETRIEPQRFVQVCDCCLVVAAPARKQDCAVVVVGPRIMRRGFQISL